MTDQKEAKMLKLFAKYDKEKKGYLTKEDVRFALEDIYKDMKLNGFHFSEGDIERIFKEADSNGDGRIQPEEFARNSHFYLAD